MGEALGEVVVVWVDVGVLWWLGGRRGVCVCGAGEWVGVGVGVGRVCGEVGGVSVGVAAGCTEVEGYGRLRLRQRLASACACANDGCRDTCKLLREFSKRCHGHRPAARRQSTTQQRANHEILG